MSALEQQLGAWTVEELAQQQGRPPAIRAQIEHAGRAWAIGWTTKTTAKKHARRRPALPRFVVLCCSLLFMLPSSSIVTFQVESGNYPFRSGKPSPCA